MTLEPGTLIGPYRITGLLGAGGMGEVYRAHDERLRRDVAVKLMTSSVSGDASRVRRMQKEAQAAGQLSHPNILAVFDVGTHGEQMYVVSELLEGESLRDLGRRGPVPWRKTLVMARQIADGLSAAHERGIIHRDIKPDNVFLTRDDRIKILDFGVATWKEPESGADATAATVSQAGLVIGTVGYMSPEQARGQAVDHRSDLFAFGCLLYELLSGHEAFSGTPMEILVAIQRDAPTPLQERVPGLPADVARIVDRCLEKEAGRRFQSTRDLYFALTLIDAGSTSGERTPALPAATGPAAEAAPKAEPAKVAARGPAASRVRWLAAGLLAMGVSGAAAIAGWRALVPAPAPPAYHQVTFRQGTVYTARFTLDGTGVLYSAAWDGKPRELFATVPGTRDSRALGDPETDVAFLLGTGEAGVLRRSRPGFSSGVLARMSLAGGSSKDLLDGIYWADGSPDGARLAVIRRAKERSLLEYPVGKVLVEAAALTYPRVSPEGSHVAFLEHPAPGDDSGQLVVVDAAGKRVMESSSWKSIEGLAWRSPSEVWFTGSKEGRSLWMYAIDLKGRTRLLARVPGRLVLHDLAPDGRVVAERNSYRATLLVGAGATPVRDLSWQDFTQLAQLSRDGTKVLFSEEGEGNGSSATAYLRSMDGSAPVRLGAGSALALSPDGSQALLRVDEPGSHLDVVPVGPGRAQRLPTGSLDAIVWAAFVPGSEQIVMLASEAGKEARLYVQDRAEGPPRPLGEGRVKVTGDALSPDGHTLAGMREGKAVLVPLDGSAPREVAGLPAGRTPCGWTDDGLALFVRSYGDLSVTLERYELATGKLDPWRTLGPPDRTGALGLDSVRLARNGEVYAYESYRLLSDLYVIENLH